MEDVDVDWKRNCELCNNGVCHSSCSKTSHAFRVIVMWSHECLYKIYSKIISQRKYLSILYMTGLYTRI